MGAGGGMCTSCLESSRSVLAGGEGTKKILKNAVRYCTLPDLCI